MSWSLNGIKIIVTDDSSKADVKISEHIILDGNQSVSHYFGYGSDKRTLKGWLLDNPQQLPAIRALHRTGATVTLTDPSSASNTYKISEFTWNKVYDLQRLSNMPITFTMTLMAMTSGSY